MASKLYFKRKLVLFREIAIAVQHAKRHIRTSATGGQNSAKESSMNSTAAAKIRPSRIEGAETVREFAQQGASYTKDMYETTKAAAGETSRLMEQTYSAVTKSAAEFNLQWIEMVRINTNSALDFSRELVGVKSPSEFLELLTAHARKQFETFSEQARQL